LSLTIDLLHFHFLFYFIVPLTMFGFGSSSTPKSPEPAAPTREQRAKCWSTRDAYFACLDKNNVVQPGEPKTAGALGDKEGKCEAARAEYEGNCGRSWVS
jgi:cytochrome c oxidase assembly factor 6